MKKRIALVSVICVALALLAFSTLAYFTREDKTTNVITMGTVEMSLTEEGEGTAVVDPEGNTTGMKFENVVPGKIVSKKPIITNTGSEMFYTRVRVTTSIEPAVAGTVLDASLVQPNIDTETWIPDGNGWYYYSGALNSGEYVSPFDSVTFDAAMGNDYQSCTVTMTVEAQAVQVKNNPVPLTGTILDVAGWPA